MLNAGPVELRQVRDFEQTIGDAFTFMKENGALLARSVLVFSAVPMMLYGFFNVLMLWNTQVATNLYSDPSEAFGMVWGTLGYAVLVLLAYLFAHMFSVATVLEYIRAYAVGEHHGMTMGELWSRTMAQFWRYFAISLLTWLISVVGFLFCVVPGIYLLTTLVMAGVVHAMERSGVSEGLGKSMKLANSEFWPLLGLCVVLYLIEYVFNLISGIPAMLVTGIGQFIPFLGDGSPMGLTTGKGVLIGLLTAMGALFTNLLHGVVVVAIALRYFSIIEKREGIGLKEKLAGFDV